jgi:hypothetical protein
MNSVLESLCRRLEERTDASPDDEDKANMSVITTVADILCVSMAAVSTAAASKIEFAPVWPQDEKLVRAAGARSYPVHSALATDEQSSTKRVVGNR